MLTNKALNAQRLNLSVDKQPTVGLNECGSKTQSHVGLGLSQLDDVSDDGVDETHLAVHSQRVQNGHGEWSGGSVGQGRVVKWWWYRRLLRAFLCAQDRVYQSLHRPVEVLCVSRVSVTQQCDTVVRAHAQIGVVGRH